MESELFGMLNSLLTLVLKNSILIGHRKGNCPRFVNGDLLYLKAL